VLTIDEPDETAYIVDPDTPFPFASLTTIVITPVVAVDPAAITGLTSVAVTVDAAPVNVAVAVPTATPLMEIAIDAVPVVPSRYSVTKPPVAASALNVTVFRPPEVAAATVELAPRVPGPVRVAVIVVEPVVATLAMSGVTSTDATCVAEPAAATETVTVEPVVTPTARVTRVEVVSASDPEGTVTVHVTAGACTATVVGDEYVPF
jgi:hypothetical protein